MLQERSTIMYPYPPPHRSYAGDLSLHSSAGFVSGSAYALGEINKAMHARDWQKLQREHHGTIDQSRARMQRDEQLTQIAQMECSRLSEQTSHFKSDLQGYERSLQEFKRRLQRVDQEIEALTRK